MYENKVRVTKLAGGGGTVGLVYPAVGMSTHQGVITVVDSGNYQVGVSGEGVGALTKHYPDFLTISESGAYTYHSWPSGEGAVRYGRAEVWPDGVPYGVGSGMAYSNGGVPVTFSR